MAFDPRGLLAAAACALLLAGCSAPSSVASDTYAGTPPGYDDSGGTMNGTPGVVWGSGKRDFAIVTFGSSSCPPIPTSVTAEPPSSITVEFTAAEAGACTDDLAPTTHEFRTPDGIDVAAPVDVLVLLRFDQVYEYELTLE